MRKKIYKSVFAMMIVAVFTAVFSLETFAAERNTQKYYTGKETLVNAGKNAGYSEENSLKESDPHFGWRIGQFYFSGYTRKVEEESGNLVFLKTAGDKIALSFVLEQDIECLNGNEALSIKEDKNGYDAYFETEKTNLGQGALIVRYTDYQNKQGKPEIYRDFLKACTVGADTQINLFEEGDYEVALLYGIRNDSHKFFGISIFPADTYYRVFFRFSVRNGNCMVFPRDVKTGAEMTNMSVTENGFYLDLAKSRYLDIDIKKEILNDGKNGLVEDTRFNRPAKDGDEYIDDGIYTITVSNRYTGENTTKTIYVGMNEILKAHVVTGLSIQEINTQLALGARIEKDGTLLLPKEELTEETEQQEFTQTITEETMQTEVFPSDKQTTDTEDVRDLVVETQQGNENIAVIVGGIFIVALLIAVLIYKKRKTK